MWNTIMNPKTGREVNLNSTSGKLVLKKYVDMIGGRNCKIYKKKKDPKCDDQAGCVWVKKKGCLEEERKEEATAPQVETDMNWSYISKHPIEYTESCSQIELEDTITMANDHYYNKTPTLTDEIYDILVEYVETHYPESTVLKNVGANVSKEKVQLPIYMPSMAKMKPDTRVLSNWLKEYPGSKITSDKLDGMSLLIDARGAILKAYTRGNGLIGQNISWIIPYINTGSVQGGFVRGELVVSKEKWEILQSRYPHYSNARNFVSGYTGRKNIDKKMMKYIDFIAYEWITEPVLKQQDQFEYLQGSNIDVVHYTIHGHIDNTILSEILVERRDQGAYEVDGIIVTDNKPHIRLTDKYPKHSKAFKMVLDDQTAEVSVLGVKWEPSMHGLLNPVVSISNVYLDGVTITKATGYNAKFIINNGIGGKIGPGAIVQLTRSGGVIPKILKVIKPYSGDEQDCLPDESIFEGGYSWTESGVDIKLNRPELNEVVQLKRIEHFFNQLGTPYFKAGIIKRVFSAGFDTIPKIVHMTYDDIINLDGMKDTLALKIIESIQTHYHISSLVDIMAGSYMFGAGFGKKRIQTIIDSIPTILEYDIDKPSEVVKLYNRLLTINGLHNKTVSQFIKHLKEFIVFYHTLPERENTIEEEETKAVSDIFKKRVFCVSGFRPDKELTNYITMNGGIVETTMNKNTTDLLIKQEPKKTTGKMKKAKEKGIRIVYLKDLYAV